MNAAIAQGPQARLETQPGLLFAHVGSGDRAYLDAVGLINERRYEVAESYYRQALQAYPNHKGATEYFGELMVERGDRAGAAKMLAKLERICTFGCAEADELRSWIGTGSPSTS